MKNRQGFAAMGHPVPYDRRQQAYDFCKSVGIEEPFPFVDQMSEYMREDKPFEAMELASKYIDITGAYRLLAILLTGPKCL